MLYRLYTIPRQIIRLCSLIISFSTPRGAYSPCCILRDGLTFCPTDVPSFYFYGSKRHTRQFQSRIAMVNVSGGHCISPTTLWHSWNERPTARARLELPTSQSIHTTVKSPALPTELTGQIILEPYQQNIEIKINSHPTTTFVHL